MPMKPSYHTVDRPKPSRRGDRKQVFLASNRWRGIRARFLAKHPECATPGCGRPATEVHHRDDSHVDNSDANLEGLCKSCHSHITVLEDGGFGRPKLEKPEPTPRCLPEDYAFV